MAKRGYHLLVNGQPCCGVRSRHIGGAVSTPDPALFLADPNHCRRCEASKTAQFIFRQRPARELPH